MNQWIELTLRLGSISTAWVLLLGGLFWFARKKLASMNALIASGIEANGRIISIKKYMAKGGQAYLIRYEFQTAMGMMHKGNLNILEERISMPEQITENASVAVVYLKDKPTVNILKNLLADKMVVVKAYSENLTVTFSIITFACFTLWGAFVFFVIHNK